VLSASQSDCTFKVHFQDSPDNYSEASVYGRTSITGDTSDSTLSSCEVIAARLGREGTGLEVALHLGQLTAPD